MNKEMENFFYDEYFCSDIGELMVNLHLEDEDIAELPDDWSVSCEESKFEKIFALSKQFVTNAVLDSTDKWEERFPEDSDSIFKQIEKAINEAIDIDKLNAGLPELYYPIGKKFTVTKADLIEYCS